MPLLFCCARCSVKVHAAENNKRIAAQPPVPAGEQLYFQMTADGASAIMILFLQAVYAEREQKIHGRNESGKGDRH
jgi:hypothetical protein